MKQRTFKQGKNFVFNYQFKTDGVSTVLDFVNHRVDKYEKKKKENKIEDKTEDKKEVKNNKKEKNTKKDVLKKSKKEDEFQELEKLTKQQIKEINDNYNVIGVDPGLRDLMTAIDKDGKVFQYSSVKRRHDTYHKFAHKIKQKERKEQGIDKIENELTKFNCKTMDKKKYLEFVHKKNKVNKEVFDFYDDTKFRNINFRVYCREKKYESTLLNDIEKFYKTKDNKKILLGYGNWSRTSCMKNFFPVPGKGFRKLLSTRFDLVLVDEFKTSCICNQTEQEMTKQKYNIDGKMKECHKVLTTSINDTNLKGEIVKRIIIDRDINGAKNILKITKSWLKNKTRPKVFCRNNKS